MKISNICTPLNHFIKKTLKTIFIILLSIPLLSNTGTQVELPQSLPEVTVDATGKANMVIDIALPVSNAFQPNIQLAYNSNTQNGIFGIGWQMPSLHTISRLELAGVHYDSDDRFVSSLGGKLQKLTTGNYRNQIESESYNLFVPSGTCGVGPMIFMDDVDNDGKTDLIKITGGKNDNHISVAKIAETQYQEYPASPGWQLRINSFVSTADIDGDGAKELWIAEENGKTLKIVRPSNYVFNQVSDTGLVIDNIGYDPNNMKLTSNNFAIDMNADGRTDFVMVYDSPNENKTRFKIYLSNGTGFSSNSIQIEVGYADSENSLRFLSDIDSDRKPEWITINKNSLDKMVVHRIDITASTSSSSEYAFSLGSTNYKNVSFADVNGDGKIDILAVLESGDVSVCLFTGDGFTGANISNSLNPKPQFLKTDNSNTFAEEQNTKVFADINGDRKADLITFNGSTIYVSFSNGNGFSYQYIDSKVRIGNNDEMGMLGFKSTTKETSVITPQGEEKKVSTQITEYNQTDIIELGKPSKVKTYNAGGNLQDEVSIQYEKVTTPNGTLTHRIKSQSDTIYENGNYFSQNTISYEYDTNGNVTKETTNIEGSITEVEKSYSPLKQVYTYTKKSNGVVIDNRVFTYTGANLSSSSVEIQPGKWARV